MNLWRRITREAPPPAPHREMSIVDDDWARLDITHEDGRHFAYLIRRVPAGGK